jgi:two-component system, cell cycle sensor histidine kinase and response regulator CckA
MVDKDHIASIRLRQKQEEIRETIDSLLRESVFNNRYALHPRRLAALGAEQVEAFLCFHDASEKSDAFAEGQKLAREGLGEKTVVAMAAAFRRFCTEAPSSDLETLRAALETAERYTSRLMEGFLEAREAQIFQDQEQLRRALSTALESQSRELLVTNHAINTSINGVILTDLDGKVTWVNASFLSLWGMESPAEAVGSRFPEFWAEDARQVLDLLPRTGGWRGELLARRKDKSTFSVELSASFIRTEEGKAIGIMTSFMDITERKRLMAQVLQAQKMDALGQLAGGITHDFNNLLTAISGYLQLLMMNTPRNTGMYEDLIQMKAAVDRGTGLTRQLRLFTRQATGNRQIISLNDMAKETVGIFSHTFPPEIAIEMALCPSLRLIEADPNQISQVLVNLCVNGRDAMMEGLAERRKGTLAIETENVDLTEERAGQYMTAPPGPYVLLRVRDTGVGIPSEVMERLFIPFVTTKNAQRGTGLGLAVVYGIVTGHHGFLDVRSAVGQGAVFEILFPTSEREGNPHAVEVAPPPLAQGQGTILVVDDEPPVRAIMSRALAACGYTVITAADGREALSKFGSGKGVHLVILDMMMPGMGGRECLAHLRAVDSGVRVLVTTGYTSDGSAQELLAEGALAIVEKPLDLQSFTETVQKSMALPRGD